MAFVSQGRQKLIENELRRLEQQVDSMDGKIRAYLNDRKNKSHPRYMELVERVQNYRIPPDLSTKHLETLLDNLQWKVFYHKKAWQQIWQNVEASLKNSDQSSADKAGEDSADERDSDRGAKESNEKKSSQSLRDFYRIQQKKLEDAGVVNQESQGEFENRIREQYRELSRNRGDDQEIVMTFNREEKRCRLELKRKE